MRHVFACVNQCPFLITRFRQKNSLLLIFHDDRLNIFVFHLRFDGAPHLQFVEIPKRGGQIDSQLRRHMFCEHR